MRPDDLPHESGADEREALERVAGRLEDQRPYPSAAFRATVRAQMARARPVTARAVLRPAYGVSGSVLLFVAALGPLGVGPFAS